MVYMFAEDDEIVAKFGKVSLQPAQILNNFFGSVFDAHAFETQDDGLQVGVETIGRYRNHSFTHGILAQIALVGGFVLDDRFVVNIFRRNIHESKIVGAFVGKNILSRDGVNMFAHIGRKLSLGPAALVVARRLQQAFEIFQGELRVHRNQRGAQLDHRVDFLTAAKAMLDREMLRRQNLPEQVFEEKLAEPAAQLGRAQDLLQRRDILADFIDAPIGLFETAQAFLHTANDLRRVVEPLTETLLGVVEHLSIFLQALVDLSRSFAPTAVAMTGSCYRESKLNWERS